MTPKPQTNAQRLAYVQAMTEPLLRLWQAADPERTIMYPDVTILCDWAAKRITQDDDTLSARAAHIAALESALAQYQQREARRLETETAATAA